MPMIMPVFIVQELFKLDKKKTHVNRTYNLSQA